MPGKQNPLKNVSYYAVFNLIRAEHGQEIVAVCRKLEKATLKINKAFLDLKFNHTCKPKELTSNNLKFSLPVKSSRGYKLAGKFSSEFLKLRITELHLKIRNLSSQKEALLAQLQSTLDENLFQRLVYYIDVSSSNQPKKVSATHKKKLAKLRSKTISSINHSLKRNQEVKKKWIANLSKTKLSQPQMAVLEKGFNYALTPKSIPKFDIVAGVETGLRQVRDVAAVDIARAKVAAI